MAIYKTGDAQPIEKTYESSGEVAKCETCGKDMIVISISEDGNSLMCPDCNE